MKAQISSTMVATISPQAMREWLIVQIGYDPTDIGQEVFGSIAADVNIEDWDIRWCNKANAFKLEFEFASTA